jgi:hypothetical protein
MDKLDTLVTSILNRDKGRLTKGEPHGWIQWKGTDVCIDVHCSCGAFAHFDGDFLYYYKCPNCKKKFAVGQTVIFYPLTDDEVETVNNLHLGFKTTDDFDSE